MRILPEYPYPQTPTTGDFAWRVANPSPPEAFETPPPHKPAHVCLNWSPSYDIRPADLQSWVAWAARAGTDGLTLRLTDTPARPYADLLESLRATLTPAAWAAGEVGLRLTLDRGRSRLLLSPVEAADLVDRINVSGFGLTLDCGATIAISDPTDWIRTLGWRLAAVRANDGLRDRLDESGNRPFGQGDVNWPAVAAWLRAIRYDGPLLASLDDAPRVRETLAGMERACPENSPTGPTG